MNENGFVKLFRKLIDWKYAQFPNAVALWVHILIRANWKDGYFMGHEIPRGSLATSMQGLAEQTGMNRSTVIKWIKRFEDDGQIECVRTQRFTIIKVSNYRAFQDVDSDGYQQLNQQQNQQLGQQQSQQQGQHNRRKKEEKEIKKERNIVERSAPKPSLSEVESFFDDNGYEASAFAFWEYYERKEWKDKQGRPLDWEEKAAQWEAREYKNKKDGSQDMVVPMPEYMREWNG